MTTFAELGLSEPQLQALHDVGYETPAPIEERAMPPLLEGRDVIGQAQTGTGKTAAFGLPLMEFVDPSEDEVQALVLTPTRELCIQVTQALRAYGARKGIEVVAVFGGAPIRDQMARLRAGGQVVVGTVGRVMDLISRHALMLTEARFVVLDEAIIFVRTKIGADRLARSLNDKGVRVKALHGDMSQGSRDGVMIAFKDARERLLVATDIAARGLDISGVSHVINYDMPNSPEVYVHRIGRTGRVGRSGRAITLVTPKQQRDLEAVRRHANTEIEPWEPGVTKSAGEPKPEAPR